MNLKVNKELKDLIPPLKEDEYNLLEQSIIKEGCRDKLITWDDTIVDGHNRYEICTKNGIPFKTEDRDFESFDAVKIWMIDNQKGRRNLTDGWKWELAQARKDIIADRIAKERKERYVSNIDTHPDDKKSESGRTRNELASELGWSTGKVAMADKVWKEAEPEVKESIKSGETSINQAYQGLKKAHVSNNSGNNEWYTPLNYIESAKKVMGNIDLDPASSDNVNNKIKANSYYTKENSGLTKKWIGNIWLNPPYESGLVDKFIDKLEEKTYNQAIVLVNNATETKWGNKILKLSDCVCFHKSRIRFISTDGKEKNSPLQGQMIIYIGKNKHNFINEFKEYGICLSVEK